MTLNTRRTAAPLLLLVTIAINANTLNAAEIYRWKDANGKYHFSDQRPATVKAEAVTVDSPEQKPNPELDQYRQSVRTNLAALDAERAEAQKLAAAQKVVTVRQQRSCKQLRNTRRAEERAAMLYTFNDNGDMQYLNDQQRSEYKTTLDQQWQRHCQ
jgi:Domain of unknown function (DUF4124)